MRELKLETGVSREKVDCFFEMLDRLLEVT